MVQMDVKGDGEVEKSNGHVELIEDALKEALACPVVGAPKPFCAAVLKLASGLSLEAATQVQ